VGKPREKRPTQKEAAAEKAAAAAAKGGSSKGGDDNINTKGGATTAERASKGQQQQQHKGTDSAQSSTEAKAPSSSQQAESAGKNKDKDVPQSGGGVGGGVGARRASSRLALFDHLPVQKPLPHPGHVDGDRQLHPAVLKLGAMFRSGLIAEDDDRVAALLVCFCNVIRDYKTPPNKTLSWDLDKYLRVQVQHLVDCRQHCIGMGNLIKQLRYIISQIAPDVNEANAKKMIVERLHSFFEDRISFARENIGRLVTDVIHHNDVILTFGSTPLLRKVLLMAAAEKRFRLIIVDSRPQNDSLKTLRALSPFVDCVYTPLSGAANLAKEATRVILGASAMLSNGSMLAAAGNAMVASLAKSKLIPVIAVCESYKFSERVQLDSIVHNELGSTREIAVADGKGGVSTQLSAGYCGAAKQHDNTTLPFNVVNLRYDCTPIGNISAVATETGLIPPTSVPVLIRELRAELERNSENSGGH
jgi:translation initiation factor eIF-2B subunit delta